MLASLSSHCRHRPLLVFLLVALGLSRSHADYSPVPRLDLKGRSYQLDSRVAIESAKRGETTFYEIAEFHSARQRRSKLRYTLRVPNQMNAQTETIYASERDHLLIHSRRAGCALLERNHFDQYLNDDVLAGFESDHLIGAARLLLFIERNFAQFTIRPDHDDAGNRPASLLLYSASFVAQNEARQRFELQLFYHVEAIQNLPYGIPRHIVIKTSTSRIVYELKRLKDLWDDRLQVDSSDASASTLNQGSVGVSMDMIAFDMFALERAIGCSRYFKDQGGQHEPELRVTGEFRFSFNARPPIERALGQLDISVAYEPHLGVLRVDHTHETRAVTTLTDYVHGRKFHIVRRRLQAGATQQVDPVLDMVLGTDQANDLSCVVTRSKERSDPLDAMWNPFSLGRMLLGTERMFYMGLAYVRGIEARVFEWEGCQLPVWLQQPAVYHTQDSTKVKGPAGSPMKFRDETHCIEDRGFSQTNVLYFSNDAEDFKLADSKLLLVEVFTRIQRTGAILNRKLYPIYDFTWHLPGSSPAGERYEDLFSLRDECLAGPDEDNEYEDIGMSLETEISATDEEQRYSWLLERPKRNIALLSMAQMELFLMSPMIYDVESRLLVGKVGAKSPGSNDQPDGQPITYRVDATMRVAQRTKALAELVFVGRGFLKLPHVSVYRQYSFEMCHMLAAHRKVDTLFAYEAPESECYLLEPDLDGDIDSLLRDVFKLNDRGTAEIFTIRHQKNAILTSNDYVNRLIVSRNRMNKMTPVRMFNPTQTKAPVADHFKFTAFYMSALDDKLEFGLNGLHWNGDNKFPGFGLDLTSGQNKRVEPKWTTDLETKNYHQETISFERCQTSCLADLECNSYSLCSRDRQISCVLSRISFDSASMVVQLLEAANEGLKIGEKFKVKLDSSEQSYFNGMGPSEEFIEVIRHPACELHNKIYREFFKRTPQTTSMHVTSVSEPVTHLEQCAKLCYQRTLSFLRSQARKQNTTEASKGLDLVEDDEPDKICDHFYYVEHANLVAKNPEIADRIAQHYSERKTIIGGYCFIGGLKKTLDRVASEDVLFTKAWLMMERYEFDIMSLYAKQDGVYLAQSKMTLDEKLASSQVGVKQNLTHPLVIRGHENLGSIQSRDNPQECAKICYYARRGVAFPICRSFDFIEAKLPSTKKFCSFNSVTLKSTLEAQRFDLIKYGNGPQTHDDLLPAGEFKATHYEPREGLVAHSLEEHYRIELANERQEFGKITRISAGSKRIHFGGFGLFCLAMVTLVSGLVLGVVVGSKLFASLVADPESSEILAEERNDEPEAPVIRFSNLVDSEGQIVDRSQAEGT